MGVRVHLSLYVRVCTFVCACTQLVPTQNVRYLHCVVILVLQSLLYLRLTILTILTVLTILIRVQNSEENIRSRHNVLLMLNSVE